MTQALTGAVQVQAQVQGEGADRPAWDALSVGDWTVAPDLNRIARGEEVVQLEPKAMGVLLHLASQPGEVASREALLAAVWPGVVVGDNALTQVVAKLRKALGDTSHEPAYVQAIAKKGYRLVAEVRRSDRASAAGAATAPDPSLHLPSHHLPAPAVALRTPRRPPGWVLLSGAVLFAAALVGSAAWLWRSAAERVPARGVATASTEPASSTAPQTIAVQAFEAIGPAPRAAAIARAITADLVTDLSKISGVLVMSGSGSSDPAQRPRYVLSGTVQQDGDRIRLNVLLTDAGAGRLVWSERFDRQFRDLFDVQDDVVRRILEVLPVKVSEAQTRRLAQRSTRNLGAWDQFIRAQAALLVRRPEQNEAARALYWQAVRDDPSFARAYAGLAMTYALEYQLGWARDGEATLARAFELAQTSAKMNPDMPEAHWVLGFVHTQARRHDLALRSLADALRLNPSYADAYALEGGIHTYLGKPAEGVPLLRLALRLNPDAGSLYFLLLGRAYYFLGDTEQAQVNLNQALQRNPQGLEARVYLAATLWLAGEREAALWQVQEIRALDPRFHADAWLATYPLTEPGQRQRLHAAMVELGLRGP